MRSLDREYVRSSSFTQSRHADLRTAATSSSTSNSQIELSSRPAKPSVRSPVLELHSPLSSAQSIRTAEDGLISFQFMIPLSRTKTGESKDGFVEFLVSLSRALRSFSSLTSHRSVFRSMRTTSSTSSCSASCAWVQCCQNYRGSWVTKSSWSPPSRKLRLSDTLNSSTHAHRSSFPFPPTNPATEEYNGEAAL